MKRYFQNWKNVEEVLNDFRTDAPLKDEEVLFAWYGYGDYCGDARVLFQRDGKLYEVSAGHCSCYGLEDQWNPTEVTWEQLAMRPVSEYRSYDDAGNEAKTAFAALINQHVPRA